MTLIIKTWHEMQNPMELSKILPQTYVFRHSEDDKNYVITIKGDPNDEQSSINVKSENVEHSATIGTVDTLPDEFAEVAKIFIPKAKMLAEDEKISSGI